MIANDMCCFSRSRMAFFLIIIGLIVGPSNASYGDEPFQRFLTFLKENNYFDEASEYLDKMLTDKTLPEEYVNDLPLEKLFILQSSLPFTKMVDQPAKREKIEQGFRDFLKSFPNNPRRMEARLGLADLVFKNGQESLTKANSRFGSEEDRQAARKSFATALELFENTLAELKPIIQDLQGARADTPAKEALRKKYQAEYRQAEILKALATKFTGETYPAESPERIETLGKAEKDLTDIVNKTLQASDAGIHTISLLYRGQVQSLLGKVDEAYDSFVRVADIEEAPFREWRVQATSELLRLLANPKQGKFENVIQRGNDLLKTMQAPEKKSALWLELQYTLAESQADFAEVLMKQSSTQSKGKNLKSNSRSLLQTVLKYPSPYQEKAKDLLQKLGVDVDAKKGDKTPEVKKFSEGLQAASELIKGADEGVELIEMLEKRKESANSDDEKKAIADDIVNAHAEIKKSYQDAQGILEKTLRVYTPNDSRDDLIKARCFHSYTSMKQEQFWNSAAVGDFTLRTSGGTELGLQSGEIALLSYSRLLQEVSEPEKPEVAGALDSLAAYMVKNFPNAKESENAVLTLFEDAKKQEKWDECERYMGMLKVGSPKYKEVQRFMGIVTWTLYQQAMRDLKKAEQQPTEKEQALLQKAESLLKEGFEGIDEGTMGQLAIECGNYLSLVYLKTNRVKEAIEVLNKPNFGPLSVVRNPGEVKLEDRVKLDTLRLTLQSVVVEAASSGKALDSKIIDDLVKEMQGIGDPEKMTGAFVSLAQDLREQLESVNVPAERSKLAETIRVLLSQVSGISTDVTTVLWAANTMLNLGKSLDEIKASPEQVMKMMKSSATAYQRILELEGKTPGSLAAKNRKIEDVQIQLAQALRGEGNYQASIDIYVKLLKANNKMLLAQMEAAKTYQKWGEASKKADIIKKGMVGADKDQGKNIVWGFGPMSKNLRDPKLKEFFYESRLHLAQCRRGIADLEAKPEERKKYYELALADIRTTVVSTPITKESAWFKDLDKLCIECQKELKQPTTGIQEFMKTVEQNAAKGAPLEDKNGGDSE